MNQIRRQIEASTSDYDREKLQERLAKLAGGVAVINVGAAAEEGIVPSGGVALIRAQKPLDTLNLTGDEKVGAEIVLRAIEAPLRELADNAGAPASVQLSFAALSVLSADTGNAHL